MATKNDITGDLIKTKTDGQDNYRDNYDKIFGKKNKNKISQNSIRKGQSISSEKNSK